MVDFSGWKVFYPTIKNQISTVEVLPDMKFCMNNNSTVFRRRLTICISEFEKYLLVESSLDKNLDLHSLPNYDWNKTLYFIDK